MLRVLGTIQNSQYQNTFKNEIKALKAKNLELADMIRERDRARFDLDRQKSSHKDELDRVKRELNFANERAEDASRSKNSEVTHVLSKYNRQISELEDSLRVSTSTITP